MSAILMRVRPPVAAGVMIAASAFFALCACLYPLFRTTTPASASVTSAQVRPVANGVSLQQELLPLKKAISAHVQRVMLDAEIAKAKAVAAAAKAAKAKAVLLAQQQQQAAATPSGGGGVFSSQDLERIWIAAGGPASAAPTAACIAEQESGGRPWAQSPTSDFGLWQINSSNASPSAMLNPMANAREAVALFERDGWQPWTTRFACGA